MVFENFYVFKVLGKKCIVPLKSLKFNDVDYAFMKLMKLSEKWVELLKERHLERDLTQEEMDILLKELFPAFPKHKTNPKIIMEAGAIAAYQALPHAINTLLSDSAPQFQEITEFLAWCWIHEGRHYKKLTPGFTLHKIYVEKFLTRFWQYYKALLKYKTSPSNASAKRLSKRFDALFSIKTGYDQLDTRIFLTKSRKESLLLVLKYPELPLHNNMSELGAWAQARKRDISLHTINLRGTEAKDALMTIVKAAKKHGVNIYDYFYGRITQKYEMPSLANLIKVTGLSGRSPNSVLPRAA
jgi:hypothetical protein